MRIAPLTVLVVVALMGGAAACSSDSEPTSQSGGTGDYVNPADDTGEYVDPSEGVTGLAFEMTWAKTPENNKDMMCMSMSMFGREWAKEQLQEGGEANGLASTVDWDMMVDLMAEKCEAEGR